MRYRSDQNATNIYVWQTSFEFEVSDTLGGCQTRLINANGRTFDGIKIAVYLNEPIPENSALEFRITNWYGLVKIWITGRVLPTPDSKTLIKCSMGVNLIDAIIYAAILFLIAFISFQGQQSFISNLMFFIIAIAVYTFIMFQVINSTKHGLKIATTLLLSKLP